MGQLVDEELGGGPAGEDLTRQGQGPEPHGAVHRLPEVLAIPFGSLTGVQGQPSAGRAELGVQRRGGGVAGPREHAERRVVAGGHHDAAVGLDRAAQHLG